MEQEGIFYNNPMHLFLKILKWSAITFVIASAASDAKYFNNQSAKLSLAIIHYAPNNR